MLATNPVLVKNRVYLKKSFEEAIIRNSTIIRIFQNAGVVPDHLPEFQPAIKNKQIKFVRTGKLKLT